MNSLELLKTVEKIVARIIDGEVRLAELQLKKAEKEVELAKIQGIKPSSQPNQPVEYELTDSFTGLDLEGQAEEVETESSLEVKVDEAEDSPSDGKRTGVYRPLRELNVKEHEMLSKLIKEFEYVGDEVKKE